MGKIIAALVLGLIVGFIIADLNARRFAKVHGYAKRGGLSENNRNIFNYKPK
jgi:uncharacterized membrane-anchored protein YhcB (DUF1043 family)